MPDKPFLRTYKIDFLNMARTVKSSISTSTQIASAQSSGSSGTGSGSAQGGTTGNVASTSVVSDTKNDLMESLISNVTDMLKEEDKLRYRTAVEVETGMHATAEGNGRIATGQSSGSKTETPALGKTETLGPGSAVAGSGNQTADARAEAVKKVGVYEPAVSVFANRETGVLIVRATSRQHEKIQEFVDQVMQTAKRQVLIEATIVEVTLSDGYKQGIDWAALPIGSKGFSITQAGTGGLATANPLNIFTLAYNNATSKFGNLSAEISLLQSFGNARVLSSPKLSVMNNQTATLKVADSKVYFTVKADTTSNQTTSTTTYTTTPNAVTIGFIMNVTPQISDVGEVTLNVRPTITRITSYVNDPSPALAAAGVVNRVPEIQTREMESIIRVPSGQIAVMGGLMQDEVNDQTDAVPAISTIPVLGEFFKHRNDKGSKTELVIFLRPVVIKDASVEGDYASFRPSLPGQNFFGKNAGPNQRIGSDGGGQ
jgi:MSHA biogenesis protein MshL